MNFLYFWEISTEVDFYDTKDKHVTMIVNAYEVSSVHIDSLKTIYDVILNNISTFNKLFTSTWVRPKEQIDREFISKYDTLKYSASIFLIHT